MPSVKYRAAIATNLVEDLAMTCKQLGSFMV